MIQSVLYTWSYEITLQISRQLLDVMGLVIFWFLPRVVFLFFLDGVNHVLNTDTGKRIHRVILRWDSSGGYDRDLGVQSLFTDLERELQDRKDLLPFL